MPIDECSLVQLQDERDALRAKYDALVHASNAQGREIDRLRAIVRKIQEVVNAD